MYEGRVEVYYNGTWGSVCDDGWDLNDAEVMCRYLGFGQAIATKSEGLYGQGSGQIWLSNLNCTGTESSIINCSHNGWGSTYCNQNSDASVKCAAPKGNVSINSCMYNLVYMICFIVNVTIRLINGFTKYEGRVEVYYNGEWGTVCDDEWDLNDSEAVCRQLGFGPAIAARRNAAYGQGSGTIWLDDLNCVGTELNIGYCSHMGWGNHDCSHYEDAGIKCADPNGNFWFSLYT